MRTSLLILILSITTAPIQGQKKTYKRWLIFLDGHEIKYKEVKKLDTSKYSVVTVSGGRSKEIAEIFRRKSKSGIIHLKSKEFVESQKAIIDGLWNEFKINGTETTILIVNGVPYMRSKDLETKILSWNREDIEWIIVSNNSEANSSNGKVKIIQTNKLVVLPQSLEK